MICLASFALMPSMSRCSSALISAVSLVLANTRIVLAAIIIVMATVDPIIKVLHFTGKLKESVAAGQLALAMSGRHPWSMVFLALTFSESGKAADADAVYEEMLGRARHQYLSPALLAFAAAVASREVEVIRHAREAVEIRDPQCQFVFSKHAPWSARLYGSALPRDHFEHGTNRLVTGLTDVFFCLNAAAGWTHNPVAARS
jgi:hypothetical protein